jgi:hypothetical protein
MVDMKITSSAFGHEGIIPTTYTCDGEDISPPLRIKNIPEGTKSLALIMDDPDAPGGTFTHWVAWNIEPQEEIPADTRPGPEGKNDFGNTGYGGPCPPSGTHRYYFKLCALDTTLDVAKGAPRKEVEDALEGHIIAVAELMGTYTRG